MFRLPLCQPCVLLSNLQLGTGWLGGTWHMSHECSVMGGSLASVAGVLRRHEEAAVLDSPPFIPATKEATEHLQNWGDLGPPEGATVYIMLYI